MPQLYCLNIVVSEDDFPLTQALVAQIAETGWEEEAQPSGEILLRVTFDKEEACVNLINTLSSMVPEASLRRDIFPDRDWNAGWRKYFTPVEAGDFLILPPWMKDEDAVSRIPIIIEPKSAFGTGHHPTTTMCLDAMSRLRAAGIIKAGQTFLDLGTGTGILGIGCVKMGLFGLGVDIDQLSIDNARENCEMNGISEEFDIRYGSVDLVQGRGFDVVVANILAEPLREMAPAIIPLIKPDGCLILSGFLAVQMPSLLEAYASMGEPKVLRRSSLATDPTRSARAGDQEADDWVCFFWPSVT